MDERTSDSFRFPHHHSWKDHFLHALFDIGLGNVQHRINFFCILRPSSNMIRLIYPRDGRSPILVGLFPMNLGNPLLTLAGRNEGYNRLRAETNNFIHHLRVFFFFLWIS
jgi:hypothetical protein